MSIKRNFSWMLFSRVSSTAAALLTGGLMNRALGPEGRGVLAEMQTWVTFFAVLFGLSMDTAIYHFANRERYRDDDGNRLLTIIALSLIYGLFAALIMTGYVMLMPRKFSSGMNMFLFTLDIVLLTSIITANLTVFIQALGNISFSAFIGVVQGVITTLVVTWAYWMNLIDMWFAVTMLLVSQIIPLLLIILYLKIGHYFNGRISCGLALDILTTGLKQHIATVATFIYTKINQVLVFRYCGEAESGIFAVSMQLAFATVIIPATLQTVLYPRVIHASDDYEVTIRSLSITFYGWGAFVALIILFAKPILLIYGGDKFLSSISTFRILMIAAWLLPVSSIFAPYYVKAGAFYLASFSALILGGISVILNFVLVPRFASTGAALATSITCLTGFLMIIAFLGYLSKKNPFVIFKPIFLPAFSIPRGKD